MVNYCQDRVNEEYFLLHRTGDYYHNSNHVHQHLTFKVVTSSDPCVMVALYGEVNELAWCERNHKEWLPLDLNFNSKFIGPIEDVIFSKNKLLVVNLLGRLFEVENIVPNPKVTLLAQALPRCPSQPLVQRWCLLECSDGCLIMVNVYFDEFFDGF